MSSSVVWKFVDGKADGGEVFHNSWRGAAHIWTALYDRHLKHPDKPYDSWMSSDYGEYSQNLMRLFKMLDGDKLSEPARAILLLTADWATVGREDFRRCSADLRAFGREYDAPEGFHVWLWADYIDELGSEVEAIGFQHTTVSENLWYIRPTEDEAGDYIPYDLRTGTQHFDVYDDLRKAKRDADKDAE